MLLPDLVIISFISKERRSKREFLSIISIWSIASWLWFDTKSKINNADVWKISTFLDGESIWLWNSSGILYFFLRIPIRILVIIDPFITRNIWMNRAVVSLCSFALSNQNQNFIILSTLVYSLLDKVPSFLCRSRACDL